MEWNHAPDKTGKANLRFVRSHVHVSFDETGDTSRPYCVECVSTLPFLPLHLRQLRRILCHCFLKAATLQSASHFSKANVEKGNFAVKLTKENVLCFCEGCLVVGCDHGPQAEVAQGVGPGPLVER